MNSILLSWRHPHSVISLTYFFMQCNIENLSSGNVTTVNGDLVQSSIILKDGDVFCVGLREFVYQNNGE